MQSSVIKCIRAKERQFIEIIPPNMHTFLFLLLCYNTVTFIYCLLSHLRVISLYATSAVCVLQAGSGVAHLLGVHPMLHSQIKYIIPPVSFEQDLTSHLNRTILANLKGRRRKAQEPASPAPLKTKSNSLTQSSILSLKIKQCLYKHDY